MGRVKGGFLSIYIAEVTKIKKKLTHRERRFCICFVSTGDVALATKRAGYCRDFAETGEALLCREEILGEIDRLCSLRKNTLSRLAALGYQRLAFGGIGDAISLLYRDSLTEDELREIDLFAVSEIKRPKDGALEIKFFDRLKALEKLENKAETASAANLFDAIGEGAEAVGSGGVD